MAEPTSPNPAPARAAHPAQPHGLRAVASKVLAILEPLGRIVPLGPVVALVLLVIFGTSLDTIVNEPESRRFLSVQNFLNILRQNSFIGIVALGMTLVIILGGIDLAVGSVVALSGGLALLVLNAAAASSAEGFELARAAKLSSGLSVDVVNASLGTQPPVTSALALSALTALGAGALCGFLMGSLIAKGRIAPFIATLGGMVVWRSVTLAMAGGGEIRSNVSQFSDLSAKRWMIDSIQVGGRPLPIDLPVLVFLGLAIVAAALLTRTRLGLEIHAIGGNTTAARYAGIKVDRVKIATYTIAGLFCAVAAILNAGRLNSVSSSGTGLMYELDAIAAVVVGGASLSGGRGRIFGTVVGVLILGIVNNMLNMIGSPDAIQKLGLDKIGLGNVNISHLQGLVKGLIIVAAVLVQRGRSSD